MKFFEKFFEKHKKRILIFSTVLFAIIAIFTVNKKYKVKFLQDTFGFFIIPIEKVLSSSNSWVSDRVNGIKNIAYLKTQNRELKDRVDELSIQNKLLTQYEQENQKLKDLLNLVEFYPQYLMVGARIIGKEPSNWYNSFFIDKGSDDNMEIDMVVLADGGLVGKIVEVSKYYSKVQAIIDDRSSVSCKTIRTDDFGILKGDSVLMEQGLCKVEYINTDAPLMIDDEIVTSNLSDVYPSGIFIGTVVDILPESHGLTKYAYIKPAVDFLKMEYVTIIINQKRIKIEE